ncbi:TetR/AcrR family transcriptional regulator [Levilactobacillus fujinensis]|uniref:TetR/AcrR family transcriptional regulator n=1 Tax=Levilactobacillus fujinensis TaxID=2486024 RepID=A0ABW1TFP3_9LACO|nr:TetR/AcrR family transcriptional regulator C-terminal domain-containing protein [Levilactobacillus fujinensis]
MKKNAVLTAVTRQNLIDAFCQLCPAKPVAQITVRELTKCAGYNRSTFYQYFQDIYDLLRTIEDSVINQIMANLTSNLQQAALTESFITAFVHLHEHMTAYYNVVFDAGNNAEFTQRLKMAIASKLRELYQVSPDTQYVDYVTDFYLSGVLSVLYRWIANDRDLPVAELADLIRQMINTGVTPQLSGKFSKK